MILLQHLKGEMQFDGCTFQLAPRMI